MWTEDGWVEERYFDIGSSSAHYNETFEQEVEEEKNPIGFIWPTKEK